MKGKSTFIFSKDQPTYTIQLKKSFKWWYLLPLLLLLFLVKCNQTIEYQTIDAETKSTLENSQIIVNISENNFSETQTTDNDGKTTFKVGKYPIYKLIFGSTDENVETTASHTGYISENFTAIQKNLTKKLNIIELKKLNYAQIIVVDSLTRKPLQGINVILESNGLSQTKISDINGNVVFDSINFEDNSEAIISTQSPDYEDVRKYYQIELPKTIHDTIALLSFDDGGLKGERGDITVNLVWNSTDDLDLMLYDPCENRIYFKNRKQDCNGGNGFLDLDANASDDTLLTNPQENIFWNDPAPGEYLVYVYFYKRRDLNKVPFTITLMLKNNRKVIDTVAVKPEEYILIDKIIIE